MATKTMTEIEMFEMMDKIFGFDFTQKSPVETKIISTNAKIEKLLSSTSEIEKNQLRDEIFSDWDDIHNISEETIQKCLKIK